MLKGIAKFLIWSSVTLILSVLAIFTIWKLSLIIAIAFAVVLIGFCIMFPLWIAHKMWPKVGHHA